MRRFTIELTPQFSGSTTLAFNAANSSAGSVVGSIQASDLDGEKLTYSLIGSSPFAIDASTGRMTLSDPAGLNSSVHSYLLTVKATGNGDPAMVATESVHVTVTYPAAPRAVHVCFA
jgi:hypothetical protein